MRKDNSPLSSPLISAVAESPQVGSVLPSGVYKDLPKKTDPNYPNMNIWECSLLLLLYLYPLKKKSCTENLVI